MLHLFSHVIHLFDFCMFTRDSLSLIPTNVSLHNLFFVRVILYAQLILFFFLHLILYIMYLFSPESYTVLFISILAHFFHVICFFLQGPGFVLSKHERDLMFAQGSRSFMWLDFKCRSRIICRRRRSLL